MSDTLVAAIRRVDLASVEMCVARPGTDVNASAASTRETPLMAACGVAPAWPDEEASERVLHTLLFAGADVLAVDAYGRTALDHLRANTALGDAYPITHGRLCRLLASHMKAATERSRGQRGQAWSPGRVPDVGSPPLAARASVWRWQPPGSVGVESTDMDTRDVIPLDGPAAAAALLPRTSSLFSVPTKKSAGGGVPVECLCPITNEKMRDPVIDRDGYSYERAAVTQWLRTGVGAVRAADGTPSGVGTSPMTRRTMSVDELVPNRALRAMIAALC